MSILDPHTWLSSDEVDAACFYIAQKFPDTDGSQSCLLYQTVRHGGVVGTPQGPFVQVLNINENHWIMTSNSTICIIPLKCFFVLFVRSLLVLKIRGQLKKMFAHTTFYAKMKERRSLIIGKQSVQLLATVCSE